MRTSILYLLPLACFCLFSLSAKLHAQEGAKSDPAIVHTVQPKETLYGISKRYGITVEELKSVNSLKSNAIKIGLVLRIPSSLSKNEPDNKLSGSNVVHKVAAGETLYALSKLYPGASIEQIQEWNSLKDYAISPGQQLIVGKLNENALFTGIQKEETKAIEPIDEMPSATEVAQVETPKTEKQVQPKKRKKSRKDRSLPEPELVTEDIESLETNQKPIEKPTKQMVKAADNQSSEPMIWGLRDLRKAKNTESSQQEEDYYTTLRLETRSDNQYESQFLAAEKENSTMSKARGLATFHENTGKATSYFALYDNAETGDILRIKNLINKRETYVKVIGKVPQEDLNQKVLIKLSGKAAADLKALDEKFIVEVFKLEKSSEVKAN